MKQRIIFLFIFVLIVFSSGCGSAYSESDRYATEISGMLNSKWQSYAADRPNFGGSLSLYVISPKGHYFASSATNLDQNTHFRTASVTKTFTAAAIMLLHQRGQLNINDLITANIPGSSEPYVPNTPEYAIPYKDQITIKMLLRHRAGVWDVDNEIVPSTEAVPYAGMSYIYYTESISPEHTYTFDELVGVVATCELSYFVPDTSFHYSDTGYSLLGKIIERVSGQSYGEFVMEQLAVPNSLSQTSLPHLGSEIDLPLPFAPGYSYYSGTLTDVTQYNVSKHVAEGNVVTTPANLARWLHRLLQGEAGLTAATVNLMTAEARVGVYGLGLSVTEGLGFGHNGGINGYVTVARHDPVQAVTVVLSASVINWNDMAGQMAAMYEIGRTAKNLLGYSTAETY